MKPSLIDGQGSLFETDDMSASAEVHPVAPEVTIPTSDELARFAAVVGRHATGDMDPSPRSFPHGEDGQMLADQITPGMLDARWGIVTGKYSGKVEKDITIAPKGVPRNQRPIAAVREYARLWNAREKAIIRGDRDSITRLDSKIDDWLAWSLENGLRKEIED